MNKYSHSIQGRTQETVSVLLLCVSTILLIGLQVKGIGSVLLIAGYVSLLLCPKEFARNIVLLYISMTILAWTWISTDISYLHLFQMGVALLLAVAIPFVVSKYIYKKPVVQFTFHPQKRWNTREIFYILFAACVSYVSLPFFLQNTGSYKYWSVQLDTSHLIRLFLGTNILGFWDELFFICTTLGILRKYFPFAFANLFQAFLFTSFLYELGFRGWGFLVIFCFALLQGVVFKKTESLLYVITIHLTIDFILYFALIHAYYPQHVPLFLFS